MMMAAATETKSRPIIFSAPMIRALLAGKKTQTRRVVKLSHVKHRVTSIFSGDSEGPGWYAADVDSGQFEPAECWDSTRIRCPYGAPGDRLWVRERCLISRERDEVVRVGHERFEEFRADKERYKLTPSIHMPRWASRITLELTEVRVQRIQAITREDVRSEGVPDYYSDFPGWVESRFPGMEPHVWDNLNWLEQWIKCWTQTCGENAWDSNPWVWALTFRRIDK